tara:strand:- start:269 stop:787 length:519 start_codon:yes stop_codon:yes gene_type:complete
MADIVKSGWFVVQLRPHGLAQARVHLKRQGFETFSPIVLETQYRQHKKKNEHKPLFPGYLFVRFDPRSNGWTAINNTRGVSRLILNDPRRPIPLPDELIRTLQDRCDPNEIYKSANDLKVGDHIRVLTGPFADLVTRIETLPGAERAGVLIELMGREVRSTLPRSHVTKVPW